ncbi:polyphenol oxidase family protein [Desulfovibrio cuneatus]|uniref:polyphenol oxidase family protein n=1 Tax=Desulfovibrio cuneatus TaxID=159728 RepID=UPI0004263F96|nr:polyphenol oxidase family protein [Desulfovibrio cuneatus]
MDTTIISPHTQAQIQACGTSEKALPTGVLPFRFPHVGGVRCLFTGAVFGDMVLHNAAGALQEAAVARRRTLMACAGATRWAELYQVHGTELCLPAHSMDLAQHGIFAAPLPRADGHATAERGVALCIKTADCQPVLLAERHGRFVAALHVGWRGNAAGFMESAVARLCTCYGCQPQDLLAVRGPSLGPGHAEFVHFAKEWPQRFAPWFASDTKTMNLWALSKAQLVQAGLLEENIYALDMCTYALHPSFYSHRRGDAGRQVALISLVETIV